MIQRELSTALRQDIKDPRLANLVITDVAVSPDLRVAKVYFTLINADELAPAQLALRNAAGHFRHIIATHIDLRYAPTLNFYYDETAAKAEQLDQLIKQAEKKTHESSSSD